jgi:hypothetical protein
MEYSCIVNGQILRVHQIPKNNPPNVIKKSTHGKKLIHPMSPWLARKGVKQKPPTR